MSKIKINKINKINKISGGSKNDIDKENDRARKKCKYIPEFERILKTPDVYFGCNFELIKSKVWSYDDEINVISFQEITYSKALLKIFDEIIVNARDVSVVDPTLLYIKIDINRENGMISVCNDGKGMRIIEGNYIGKINEYKAGKNWLLPEMTFGAIGTGTNYKDDNEKDDVKRITGGKNGIGAKLTNRGSKYFEVETIDLLNNLSFKQIYEDNMKVVHQSIIEKLEDKDKKSYTKITFLPDYGLFGLENLDNDNYSMLVKRVYDMVACTRENIEIYLNDKIISGKNLNDYANYFIGDNSETKRVYFNLSNLKHPENKYLYPDWNVVICPSADGKFQHFSFVNGIATYLGGTHIKYVTEKITKAICEKIKTSPKAKGINVTPDSVKQYIWIFLNATVVNPEFTNQAKVELSTTMNKCEYKTTLEDMKIINSIVNLGIMEKIIEYSKFQMNFNIPKNSIKNKTLSLNFPKLDDAYWAGKTPKKRCDCGSNIIHAIGGSKETTLILTEGDSAKAFAVAGVSSYQRHDGVQGKDIFGVFPLRGKFLNVKTATLKQLKENNELLSLIQIIGLEHKKVYENTNGLRYGHIMLLVDQDLDGYHIKGLLMNFFHHFWPSLLNIPGFIQGVNTPIVVSRLGNPKSNNYREIDFYTLTKYREWKESINNNSNNSNNNEYKKWNIKYYKGLGTWKAPEAKAIFKDVDKKIIKFTVDDMDECNESLDLAFKNDNNKVMSNKRKKWLSNYNPNIILEIPEFPEISSSSSSSSNVGNMITYDDFIKKELIHFSMADNIRSIPSIVDGLKPSQRKVLFSAFKRDLTSDVKVSQFAGYISENSAYHHGEASLHETIIKMAQDYVGSNNINLFYPSGQFGTRLLGGEDHASPRYIYTQLSSITKKIFNSHDFPLLNYLNDEGQDIEPEYYIPIIPMILVNGSKGIGTGWSNTVPPFNPLNIIDNLLRLLDDKPMEKMHPWYRKFKGKLEYLGKNRYQTKGIYKKIANNRIEITELPICVWKDKYVEHLQSLSGVINKNTKNKANTSKAASAGVNTNSGLIKDVITGGSEENIQFIIIFNDAIEMRKLLMNEKQFEKTMKLVSTQRSQLSNIHLFDINGKIKKYEDIDDIMLDFYKIRLLFYEKRKEYQTTNLQYEVKKLEEKVRFINGKLDGTIILENKKTDQVVKQLENLKFQKFYNKNKNKKETKDENENANENDKKKKTKETKDNSESTKIIGYEYLLNMQLMSLTKERVDKLRDEMRKKMEEFEYLSKKSPKDLWKDDLIELKETYKKWNVDDYDKPIKNTQINIIPVVSPLTSPDSTPCTSPRIIKKVRIKLNKLDKGKEKESDDENNEFE
jgi:DNA topoisomerase-2